MSPLSEEYFNKVKTCSIEKNSCELDNLFAAKKMKLKKIKDDIRIRIKNSLSGKQMLIMVNKNIRTDQEIFKLSDIESNKTIESLIIAGDSCTAQKRYERMCLGKEKISKILKKVCDSLKKGEVRVEISL